MARIVFISNYLKGGKDAARLKNRVHYFATREGVEVLKTETASLPPTKKQQDYILRLTRSFPNSKELLEYIDYQEAPTQSKAAAFIEQVQELYIDLLDERENHIDYIAHRPGVQYDGDHGLWDANGKVQNLSATIEEVSQHTGNVWTPIIALRREDAVRLNYDNAENWRALVNASICDIAKGYKIHPDHLRWYAAFHEKENQVHIHMVVFSTEPREGYLTKQGIREVKSAFAKQIYRQDLISVYEKQTEYRDTLQDDAEGVMAELIAKMTHGDIHSEKLERLTVELAERLKCTTGKKVYGYLPPATKRIVDAIVDELSKDERVSAAYALWQNMRDEVLRTYSDNLPERLPLSQQKEFKPVRNMVIREALKLSEMTFSFDDEDMDDESNAEEASSSSSGRPRSVYRQAEEYRHAKKILSDELSGTYEKAKTVSILERLWNEGYAIAAHQLGKVYRDGLAETVDVNRAVDWFRRSAEAGNDFSAYALGKLLLESGDTAEALRYLKQAAEAGHQYAQYALGKLYFLGCYVERDLDSVIRVSTVLWRNRV